jgi:hypothetical protein
MEAVLYIVGSLAVLALIVVYGRKAQQRRNERLAAEARKHRQADRERFERDRLAAAALRERLEANPPSPQQMVATFLESRERFLETLPESPKLQHYPGLKTVDFDREVIPERDIRVIAKSA